MSFLSLALTDALHAAGWSQTELAQKASITQPQANRACRGKVVGPDTMRSIALAFPLETRGGIIAGWLKDQLDADLAREVEIHSARSRVAETPTFSLPEELDAETRDLILWLAQQAVRHTAVRDALRSLQRAAGVVSNVDSRERARSGEIGENSAPADRGNRTAKSEREDRVDRALQVVRAQALSSDNTLQLLENQARVARGEAPQFE
jgi:transcriptional regulator with XRE-family HTH domain